MSDFSRKNDSASFGLVLYFMTPVDLLDSSREKIRKKSNLDLFLFVIFYGFYHSHSKSPFNHHLGEYVFTYYPSTLRENLRHVFSSQVRGCRRLHQRWCVGISLARVTWRVELADGLGDPWKSSIFG